MGRASGTPDRLTGPPGPLRAAALVVVLVLVVAALAALNVLDGTGPSAAGPFATGPSATDIATGSGIAQPAPSRRAPSDRATRTTSPTIAPAVDPESGLPTIRESALPKAARLTLDLIVAGGPFRYAEDGTTFHNLEKLLPLHGDGYYHEFTVETPGSGDRGPRRIVAGARGERYWTDDHYATFWRIVP
jgi:guanyl-specific ribonuclease Sa